MGPALKFGVTLLALPGGTFNRFAADLSVETIADACNAVAVGTPVQVGVGRVKH
ncbi:hypothetical protein ABZX62_06015 [Streptomyces flavidovirens]|uniref:hypothetical protein n=1 Tax=Streptomyces flavidovirens TaxID=67298 RepID=UPI0033A3D48F